MNRRFIMEFHSTFTGTRPTKCTEQTRQFAWDSLHAVYGRQTYESPHIDVDDIEGFPDLSVYDKHDIIIKRIAENAPIRLCKGELLVGSATLGDAIFHRIPANFGGNPVLGSMSHHTCNFDRALREGLDTYRARIDKRLNEPCTPEQKRFLESLVNVFSAMKIWHERYLSALRELRNESSGSDRFYYEKLCENLEQVPFSPPKNYWQAMQSLWFLFAFSRLCGNWPGIGRLDLMVGKMLDDELAEGLIEEEAAREIMAHFFIKGCEWIRLDSRGTGDAQHYQNIVLSGCDENGKDITNTATRLALEIVEEFPIPDFPIAVRITQESPGWLIDLIARVMRHGSGVAAVYNEKLIIDSLVEFGYDLAEARQFANDGCWEVQIPGKTAFGYAPMDGLDILQKKVFHLFDDEMINYETYEDLASAYDKAIAKHMEDWHNSAWVENFSKNGPPCSVLALLEDDCIENAADYTNGGTRYRVLSPHLGGLPDAANELYAVKKLVYEEKKLTFPVFMEILKNNWKDSEELRLYARRSYSYYGNDNDECDDILVRIMDTFMTETRKIKMRNGVMRPAGISTFGRQIDWKDSRKAHAHGFFTGDILASNLSPTPTTDSCGATAVIRSHCKIDFSRLTCGTALDIKLDPTTAETEAISALIRGFIILGGFFLQIDVQDNSMLRDAVIHPENYPNLAVRLSGWSARFVTLNEDWQRMIIERT